MLSSLLPGIRELRTPLVAGYLWLIDLWLILGPRVRHLRFDRPAILLREVGDYVGQAGVIAALSFIAYMLGSFIEVDPLRLWEHGGRRTLVTRVRNLLRRSATLSRVRVLPMSRQAARDLEAFSREELGIAGAIEGMSVSKALMQEEQQIATRLQAANVDLFGKYDRLLAESSFRLNVATPLVLLLLLLIWGLALEPLLKVALSVGTVLYGLVLIRQAVGRAIQSRDVITQSLIVGVIQSRSLRRSGEHTRSADDGVGADST